MIAARIAETRKERAVVLAVIAGGGAVLLAMILGLLAPLWRERAETAREIAQAERDLEIFRHRYETHSLSARVADMARRRERLTHEWEELRARADTFKGGSPLPEALSAFEEGRIDFKVALSDARMRVEQAAKAHGVEIPENLQIPETIRTDERADTRLWQLAATVKLLELAIGQGVKSVGQVTPLPPVRHALLPEENALALEFPVLLKARCSFDTVSALLDSMAARDHFFALRRFRLERTDREHPDLLLTLVCGGMRYRLRQPGDPVILPRRGPHE